MEFVIGIVAVAVGAILAWFSIAFFQRGKRSANNALWFLGRWGPPQNDPRPSQLNRGARRDARRER